MRFRPLPGFQVLHLTGTPYELDNHSYDQALVLMNAPVEGEPESTLGRQARRGLPMALYMCLWQCLSLNWKADRL